jgi:uncharacterized protein
MGNENNPFVVIGYKGKEYFCDRKEEAKQLTRFMLNGVNVTLFAIRRLGKTGLLHHVFDPYKSSRKVACIYVDILATKNLTDFTNSLATAVYNRFPPQQTLGKKVMQLFQRFRPVISFDEFTGAPELSLTMKTQAQKEKTIDHIFKFIDQQNIKIVFAIDEFQQILSYPEKNTEALLRTSIQQLKNSSFIFCGSNQQMMHEIFNAAKRPFFASCTSLDLDYIPKQEYLSFIKQKLEVRQRTITGEALEFIADWTMLHTFYTQSFCNAIYAKNKDKSSLEDVLETAAEILKLNENTYFQYRNLLTPAQWNLLCAIAKEERVIKPQSKQFITTHHLGTPALVKRGLDALLKKDIIFYNSGAEQPYYEVYDKFLMRWIQNRY